VDDWPLVNLPDIIKICVYCNLLYYREIRYTIANKWNQFFINFDIQRRLTKHAYKRDVNLLSSSCRNKKKKKKIFGFGMWTINTNNAHFYSEGDIL
jgi:hypothetical protein